MSALIGALRVSLSADTASFQQGMKRAEAQAKTSASSINKSFGLIKAGFAGFIGGLSIGTIVQGVKASLDYAGSLGEIAQQLGVTTKELQTFRFAVQQNGGTLENADQALGKFSIAISKALSGSKEAAKAFGAVGVSLNDLQTKSRSDILGQIADGMKATGGASANAAAGVAIFGRGFQKIIPVLDQGSEGISASARAAEEFGLVLSDEQIQNADVTADKIDQLMTALKVKIAADVADNADSIGQFVQALFDLVRAAEDARAALVRFQQNYNLPNLIFKGDAFGKGVAGRSVTTDLESGGTALAIARKMGLKLAGEGGGGTSGSQSNFLSSGGSGGKKRSGADDAERKRLQALRDQFQFDEDMRRQQMDILRAQEQLATDYSERAALQIQMLNLDQESFKAGIQYQVQAKEITQAQASQLEAQYAIVDGLQRELVLQDEEKRRREDYNRLDEKDFDIKMDLLERHAALAETASERRDVELRILDLAYEEERRRLQRIVDESEDWAEIEAARRDLLNLTKKKDLDRQGVINATRGPMEDYLASLPTTAAKAQEALEHLQVQGFEGLIDAAVALTEGFDSAKEALLNTLKQFLQGFLRMQLQQSLGGLLQGGFNLGSLFGGFGSGPKTSPPISGSWVGPRMAGGGGFTIKGVPGVDRNVMAINGVPVARVGFGETVNVHPANDMGGGSSRAVEINVYANDADSFRRSQSQIARQARRRLGV